MFLVIKISKGHKDYIKAHALHAANPSSWHPRWYPELYQEWPQNRTTKIFMSLTSKPQKLHIIHILYSTFYCKKMFSNIKSVTINQWNVIMQAQVVTVFSVLFPLWQWSVSVLNKSSLVWQHSLIAYLYLLCFSHPQLPSF